LAKRERPFACPSSAKERGVGALLPIEFHTYAEQLTVANYIKLTNLVHNKTGADKPGAGYVNVDQICWIGTPVGAADAYKTVVMMSGTFVNVKESVVEVMQLINGPPTN
jgi:hypothetical protein